jgi:integrase
MTGKKPKARKARKLTDEHITSLREFEFRGLVPDSVVQGLFIYLGVHRTSWIYKKWARVKGKLKSREKTIGHWPALSTPAARIEALKEAATFASGAAVISKKDATTLATAFARHLEYLTKKATDKGKPDRWRYNVEKLGKLILPTFGHWTLVEMSQRPDIVSDWHAELYKQTPVSADHCARIIRAIYRREARRDRSLPPALPTSAIEFTKYEPSQVALDFKAYPAWRKAWEALESPVHRGYHLFCLLTGCRPGEGSRIRLNDIDTDARMFVIRNAKAGKDIYLPITPEIAFAISLAVNAEVKPHHEVKETDFAFPGCRQISQRAKLPIRGQALRHSYSTVAVDLKIDDLIRHFLMGHAPKGISQDYVALLILQNGPAMREAQEQISKRIAKLLGHTSATLRQKVAAAPAASLETETGQARALENARTLARALRVSGSVNTLRLTCMSSMTAGSFP